MYTLIQHMSIQHLLYTKHIIGTGNREVNETNMVLNFGGKASIRLAHTITQGCCDRGVTDTNASIRQST